MRNLYGDERAVTAGGEERGQWEFELGNHLVCTSPNAGCSRSEEVIESIGERGPGEPPERLAPGVLLSRPDCANGSSEAVRFIAQPMCE